jgi:hypothetical protein
MSIILRPVAITDLNVKFARDMGNNKVRHYSVSHTAMLVNHFTDKTPQDMVRDYIYETENTLDVEFVPPTAQDRAVAALLNFVDVNRTKFGPELMVKDVTDIILKNDKPLLRALLKTRATQLLHMHTYYNNFLEKAYDQIASLINRYVISPLISCGLLGFYSHMRLLGTKRMAPVKFMSVAFRADQVEMAVDVLLNDLKKLEDRGLILGHLVMPSIIQLADTVGIGSLPYALFCFPIVDEHKLNAIINFSGKDPDTMRLKLSEVGVRCETFEGGIYSFNEKGLDADYDIEVIDIEEFNTDQIRLETIKAFEDSKDLVNEVAAKNRKALGNLEKVDSRSVSGANFLEVDVTLRNKETGKEIVVNSALRNKLSGND